MRRKIGKNRKEWWINRMKRNIYLDHAATTQPFPEVLDAMLPFYGNYYGNPSAGYELGEKSKKAIEEARGMIAATLSVEPETIYFTSGGTEADNWALNFAARMPKNHRAHIITSAIEHHAVLNTCRELEQRGIRVTYVPVNRDGIVDLAYLARAITPETTLISIMFANNEIGTIQPVEKIGWIAKKAGVLFHTDAVQAYGQIPINPNRMGIDMMSVSGHKLNGPKGIGFLYVKKECDLKPFLFGGGQERKMRAGTENVPGIVGIGKAAQISHRIMKRKIQHEIMLRNYLIQRIFREIPSVKLNGSLDMRLPNNVNVSIAGVNGGALVALMDLEGVCVSAASACSVGSGEPSHVLLAIGNSKEEAYGSVRLTLGPQNTREEIDLALELLKKSVFRLREMEEN